MPKYREHTRLEPERHRTRSVSRVGRRRSSRPADIACPSCARFTPIAHCKSPSRTLGKNFCLLALAGTGSSSRAGVVYVFWIESVWVPARHALACTALGVDPGRAGTHADDLAQRRCPCASPQPVDQASFLSRIYYLFLDLGL